MRAEAVFNGGSGEGRLAGRAWLSHCSKRVLDKLPQYSQSTPSDIFFNFHERQQSNAVKTVYSPDCSFDCTIGFLQS